MIPTPYVVTVRRYTEDGTDAHGNPSSSYVDEEVEVHAVAPGPSAERLAAGRDVDSVAWTVYAPRGVSVSARDRVEWLGVDYEVIGGSLDWSHGPWEHPTAGVVFELRRTEG